MKFYLRRVHLDKGGYANKGKDYFGIGEDLYVYYTDSNNSRLKYVRAPNRQLAKLYVISEHPKAKFFN